MADQVNIDITKVEGTAVLSTGEAGGTKFLREDGDGTCSWQTPSGAGDVSGPGGAVTDNAIVRWDGIGGTSVQGSGITVDDSNAVAGATIDGDSNTLSNLDLGIEVDWAAADDVTTASAFESGDKVLIYEAGVGLRKVDYDDLPAGGGGLTDVVDDTSPQLGGQLDVNGNAIGDGTLELLKFSETLSAVNEITVTNAATGNAPSLSATGDDTDIDLELTAKGTGDVTVGGARVLTTSDTGSTVQAYDAGLADIAGLAVTDGNIIVGDGANWIAENGATARASLGLTIGTHVQAYDADLTTWAGITPGTGVGTFLATPSSANLIAAITDETGTGALVFGTSPTIGTPTLTSPVINTGVSGTAILDDDTMATASATTLATSESIKAYVDNTALLDSEVDADIKTLSLPASTTISAFGATLVDDADAATARTTLGLVIGTNVQAYDADLTTWAGVTPGTGVATALAVNIGSAGAPVLFDGDGGTPSAITLTNGTGLPVSGITASTSTAIGVGSIELGHASDTTIARSGAGVVTIEGVEVTTNSATQTLTNKTLTSPVLNTGVSGTAVLDEDNMASNSATQLATQQSIKAYVDAESADGRLDVIQVPLTSPGGTITAGDKFYFDFPFAGTLTKFEVKAQTAPTTSSATFDLSINASWGSTPTTMLSGNLALTATNFEASDSSPSVTSITAGDVGEVEVVAADSGGTCADAIALIHYTRS